MKFIIFTIFALFVSCQGEGDKEKRESSKSSTSDANQDRLDLGTALILQDETQLPACNEKEFGKLVYLESTRLLKVCKASGWTDMDFKGEKGEAGAQGAQGEQGAQGKEGEVFSSNDYWRNVWKEYVRSVAYIETEYDDSSIPSVILDGFNIDLRDVCINSGLLGPYSGTGFIVDQDRVVTNGHVASPVHKLDDQFVVYPAPNGVDYTAAELCGVDEVPVKEIRVWFPEDLSGETKSQSRPPDAVATKVDFSIGNMNDTALLEVSTGDRKAFVLSERDPSEDRVSGPGVSLQEEVGLIGFSGGLHYPQFGTGRINSIQELKDYGPFGGLIGEGFVQAGNTYFEYDLMSGGGASGSALLDTNGKVIGINFAGYGGNADISFGFGVLIKHLRELPKDRVWTDLPSAASENDAG